MTKRRRKGSQRARPLRLMDEIARTTRSETVLYIALHVFIARVLYCTILYKSAIAASTSGIR